MKTILQDKYQVSIHIFISEMYERLDRLDMICIMGFKKGHVFGYGSSMLGFISGSRREKDGCMCNGFATMLSLHKIGRMKRNETGSSAERPNREELH